MNAKKLLDTLKAHVDSGYGGDEVIIQDNETGSTYEISNAEADGDSDQFIVYVEME